MIAQEILNQLGGRQFLMMVGAKATIALENGVQIKIGRNDAKITDVIVRVNKWDLYDVEFSKYSKLQLKTVKSFSDVYDDKLTEIFESVTGLKTRLF